MSGLVGNFEPVLPDFILSIDSVNSPTNLKGRFRVYGTKFRWNVSDGRILFIHRPVPEPDTWTYKEPRKLSEDAVDKQSSEVFLGLGVRV